MVNAYIVLSNRTARAAHHNSSMTVNLRNEALRQLLQLVHYEVDAVRKAFALGFTTVKKLTLNEVQTICCWGQPYRPGPKENLFRINTRSESLPT